MNKNDFDSFINKFNKPPISLDQAWKNIIIIREKQEQLIKTILQNKKIF